MSDSQREKFEAWAENDAQHLYVNYIGSLECYSNSDTQTAWESWQAAIESMVVKFPEPSLDEWSELNLSVEEVEKSISDAGIKCIFSDA